MEIPGGPCFIDVTRIFEDASEEMALGELITADGFTLTEAMGALEASSEHDLSHENWRAVWSLMRPTSFNIQIGDPRMDSGAPLQPDENQRTMPGFDPLRQLLPEEICWILDRALSCEMQWHSGSALAQTVYTCLFVPCFDKLDPGRIPPSLIQSDFTNVSLRLITLVLRAGIIGLMKCCDLAYKELVKGNVHDCEDWQGEKSGVPLCETIQPQSVFDLLIDAESWLESDEAKDIPHKKDLLYRIQLRRALLSLYNLELPQQAAFIRRITSAIHYLLNSIKQRPLPLREDSPAYTVFDPHIARQLRSIIPMRALNTLSSPDTWAAVEGLIDGYELIFKLSECKNLLAWNAIGQIHACHPRYKLLRPPFIRSLAQSIFCNGTAILERYPPEWLVDRFFFETADIMPSKLTSMFEESPLMPVHQQYDEFQSHLLQFILQHIWAAYHNRPRQRRHNMKAALEWHVIYDRCVVLLSRFNPRDSIEYRVLKSMPLAIQHWGATVIRDIILSGFELELYMADERPFAYWYLVNVLDSHESILYSLLPLVSEDSLAHFHLSSQLQYVLALKDMSSGSFLLTCAHSPFDKARRWANYTVRYKWALRKEFEEVATLDPFLPDFRAYLRHERKLLRLNQCERQNTAVAHFENALHHLSELDGTAQSDFAFQLCLEEFTDQHLSSLILLCESLKNGISTSSAVCPDEDSDGDALRARLRWDPNMCAWFPTIVVQQQAGQS